MTCVNIFVGAVYRFQNLLSTEGGSQFLSIAHLIIKMLEIYKKGCDIRYVAVLNMNAALKTSRHKSFERI